jgi:hypothetical protein
VVTALQNSASVGSVGDQSEPSRAASPPPFARSGRQMLFRKLYGLRSVIIATNLTFGERQACSAVPG